MVNKEMFSFSFFGVKKRRKAKLICGKNSKLQTHLLPADNHRSYKNNTLLLWICLIFSNLHNLSLGNVNDLAALP